MLSFECLCYQAVDKDSGGLGQVEYRLIPDGANTVDYFAIDPSTGNIRTKRVLDSIPMDQLPIRLTVEARDNPAAPEDSNAAQTQVVVSWLI